MIDAASGSVASVDRSGKPCADCGATTPCVCAEVNEALSGKWGSLIEAALADARARRFRLARERLEEADGLKALPGAALVALGLSYLASGDVSRAVSTWARVPDDSDVHSQAIHLLQKIESHEVAGAFDAYARALANARADRVSEALLDVRRCREALPDLIPAASLELLLTPAGEEQRDLARRLMLQFPDDRELLALASRALGASGEVPPTPRVTASPPPRGAKRAGVGAYLVFGLVGGGLGALGTVALRAPVPQRSPAVIDSAVAETRSRPAPLPTAVQPTATEPTTVELALSESASDLDKLKRMLLATPQGYTTEQIAAVDRRLDQAARMAYSRGRLMLTRGDTVAAIIALRDASKASPGSYHTDDALYLLTLLLDSRDEADEATKAARQLLDQHPNSMYRNSTVQRIASRQPAGTP